MKKKKNKTTTLKINLESLKTLVMLLLCTLHTLLCYCDMLIESSFSGFQAFGGVV